MTDVTAFAYDEAGRKISEVNANDETNRFVYTAAGDLSQLIDGRNNTNRWNYDEYGRVTNKVDALGAEAFRYAYDASGRMTNRVTPEKGTNIFSYDPVGNLTNVNHPSSADITMAYDALNRLTSMIDAAGTNVYAYKSFGALASEDGPWPSDTVSYDYASARRRSGMALNQPNAAPFPATYGYDSAHRLQSLASPAGSFTYGYLTNKGNLVDKLTLPNSAYITNVFDGNSRLFSSTLKSSDHTELNLHVYTNNVANQRLSQTRLGGDFVKYTYDDIGQLTAAVRVNPGNTSNRGNERLSWTNDAAGNIHSNRDAAWLQTLTVDSLNQLTNVASAGVTYMVVKGIVSSNATSVTVNGSAAELYPDSTFVHRALSLTETNFAAIATDALGNTATNSISILPTSTSATLTYDQNGNLTNDTVRSFAYDDDNQLIRVTMSNVWSTAFVYDGKMRRRIRFESNWVSSAWVKTKEVRYVYDGMLVIQERDGNNLPTVTYTRGNDLSASLQGAGGIGGLLARTDHTTLPVSHAYYHADGNGNVTMLLNQQQTPVAHYWYHPFGNVYAKSGPLADINTYQFSSKEFDARSGLVYYGYRFYDPMFQRWITRDPIGELGGANLYAYTANNPTNRRDPFGLDDTDDKINCYLKCDKFCGGPGIPAPDECLKNCYANCDEDPHKPPSPIPPLPRIISPKPPSKPLIKLAWEVCKGIWKSRK